jgi:nucleoside 2-deoxyribosyltransferase
MKKIYFASPWFTKEQEEREERLKKKLRELNFKVWSPKEMCICDKDATMEIRDRVFKDNCENIRNSNIIFVVTDGKDVGTIWEAGYASGINYNRRRKDKIKIIYYCETLGDGKFNLMLANSGDIVITKFDDLEKLINLEKREYNGFIE